MPKSVSDLPLNMECGIRNKVLGYHRHIAQQMMINYGKLEGVSDDHQDCMTPRKF